MHEHLPIVLVGDIARVPQAAEILHRRDAVIYGLLLPESSQDRQSINDIPVLGSVKDPAYHKMLQNHKLDYAVIDTRSAERIHLLGHLFELTGRHPVTLDHPQSHVSPYAEVASGCLLEAGAIVQPNARVEALTYLGPQVVVESDAVVGAACTLRSGVIVGEGAMLGNEVELGYSSIVLPNHRIPDQSVLEARSLVDEELAPSSYTSSQRLSES